MIIYSLLRATKEGATGRTVLVMMSVGLTEALHGPPVTPLTSLQGSNLTIKWNPRPFAGLYGSVCG